MELAETAIYKLVEKILGSSNDAMSRDSWKPDHSFRVCYECDSQFSLFNRRHHCHICGRVFCGKCTVNTLPSAVNGLASLNEGGQRLRICKFCFKLREHDFTMSNGTQSSTPTLTPSSSCRSLASNSTSGSSSASSSGYPGPISAGSRFRGSQADCVEPYSEKKQRIMILSSRRSIRSFSPRNRESSPSPYDFCSNRSDDENAEYRNPRLYEMCRDHHDEEEDDSCVEMELRDYCRKNQSDYSEHPTTKTNDPNDKRSRFENVDLENSLYRNVHAVGRTFSRSSAVSSDDFDGPEEVVVEDGNFYTPLYQEHGIYQEAPQAAEQPFDVQNNTLIWVPPSPEDEEDETEISMVDDDDDDDDYEGSWGLQRSSGSMSISEYRSREKAASHEQRKAMRAVVDGHFRALVAQLLNGEGLSGEEHDKESWLDIVPSLSWQAASLVKPDTSKGGGMDPGGYVKVKCIATGQRSESYVVKGVVCKGNVIDRRMTSRYKNPRLLLLGGALEYQRVTNQLSSLDTLLQQEKDHLSMTVARIEAHHPNVVLVEKTVSSYARDRLLAKEISLVLNVKRPLLERIARCTGAHIVSAPDKLSAPKTGHCELFHVERCLEEHASAGQVDKKTKKHLMFFEGCPKPLGCTVLLKGANGDELKKVKHVVQLAVFAAYHLALETSFLADEGASLPDPASKSPISVTLPDKQHTLDRSISTIPGFLVPSGQTQMREYTTQVRVIPAAKMLASPLSSSNVLSSYESASKVSGNVVAVPFFATSSCVSSTVNSPRTNPCQPFGFQESFDRSANGKPFRVVVRPNLQELCMGGTKPVSAFSFGNQGHCISGLSVSLKNAEALSSPNTDVPSSAKLLAYDSLSMPTLPVSEMHLNATSSLPSSLSLYDKCQQLSVTDGGLRQVNSAASLLQEQHLALQVENQEGLQSEDQESNQEDFPPSPSDHQSILVSYSSSCLRKGVVCERGRLLRIKYYGSFDKPLGRFLRDDLFDQMKRCNFCEEPIDAHIYCYTHRQGSLTISVQHQNQALPGEREGKIWMWHRCLKCFRINGVPPATRRVVMSDAAWGLSFGKFLELSFSNHAAASRVAACGHSLHRDCLRFYGFGSMVACFRYALINVHSVYLPPAKLEFNNPEQQEWLRSEALEIMDQGNVVFAKAFDALCQIGGRIASYGSRKPEARKRMAELEASLQKDKAGFEEALQKAVPLKHQPVKLTVDILELNRIRLALVICSVQWDKRLQYLASTLKLVNSCTDTDSSLFESHSFLFSKDASSESSNERPAESQGAFYNNHESSVHGVGMSFSGGVQQLSEDNSLNSLTIATEKLSPDNVDATSEHTNLNKLIDDAVADVRSCLLENGGPLLLERLADNSSQGKEIPSSYLGSMEDSSILCASLLKNDTGVRRALSEGQFPILPDLSDAFEAAWTGKGQSVEAHAVHISPNGQEISPTAYTDDTGGEVVGENSDVTCSDILGEVLADHHILNTASGRSTSLQEGGGTGPDSMSVSTPVSPAKVVNVSQEMGGWVGTPFTSLYRSYSKSSQSSLTGSPPRAESEWLPRSSSILSFLGQVGGRGGPRVELLLGINDTVIAVYDDEPTSIIAYAIVSYEYQAHLSDRLAEKEIQKDSDRGKDKAKEQKDKDKERGERDPSIFEGIMPHPLQLVEPPLERAEVPPKDRPYISDENLSSTSKRSLVGDPLLQCKAMHVKVSFSDDGPQGKVKYTVTCYCAKQFDALQKKCCPSEMDFVRSLCRSKKWGAQGGKSNVYFAKTSDDRFVIKQLTKTELESFLEFAPEYFKYLSDALCSGSPTCLAKILGIFQVTIRHGKGGKEVRMDLMVMENLLYGRHVTRLYDLKGSVRSRYNADATGTNKVLLDQNFLESMQTNPIFISNKAKRLLERAVWNDTAFLASVDVMDYSLLVGVDEEQGELVLGIIDFVRQYTWDKHLETWVKASGILGGPKNAAPTVISPKQYKKRFRKAMNTYFLMVPDQWSPSAVSGRPLPDAADENFSVGLQYEVAETTNLKE